MAPFYSLLLNEDSASSCAQSCCAYFCSPDACVPLGVAPSRWNFSCRGFYSMLAPASSKCRSWNFSFLNIQMTFNLLCATYSSVSCMPGILPCWTGCLSLFLISRNSQNKFCFLLNLSWWYLEWTPSHLLSSQDIKREKEKTVYFVLLTIIKCSGRVRQESSWLSIGIASSFCRIIESI